MRWGDRVRRVLVSGLALALVAPFMVPAPGLADEHDVGDGDVEALKAALAQVLDGLGGIDAGEAMLDPVPLTPAGLDRMLSLPSTLGALATAVAEAPDDLAGFVGKLADEISVEDLPGLDDEVLDDLGITALTIAAAEGFDPDEFDLEEGELDLVVNLTREVGAPLVMLADLVAYDADALPVVADFTAPLAIEFDPSVDDFDVEVSLGEVSLGASVGATFGSVEDPECDGPLDGHDPLAMNVGILAVEATGEVCGSVELEASAAESIALDDWTTTPPRDLFEVDGVAADASASLEVRTDLDGIPTNDEGVAGTITFDWDDTAPDLDLTGWQTDDEDVLTLELGPLEDFRNIVLEEVVAGIAQLAVSLGATQLSGAADFRLPLLRERTSELAHLGQGVLDWLLAQEGVKPNGEHVALARIADDGRIQLLEELDREALVAMKLTDLDAILDSLAEHLDLDGVSYAPDETELLLGLGWEGGVGDIGLPGDPDALRFNLSDRLAAATGLSGLGAAVGGGTEITVDPHVEAQLDLAIDLSFDEVRADFEAADFDLDAFDGDVNELLAITERVQILTDESRLALDLPVTGTLDLVGTIGFLGLSASTGDGGLSIGPSGDGPMLEVGFVGDDDGRLTLTDLVEGLVTDSEANADSTIDVDLDVVVEGLELALEADIGGEPLGGIVGIDVDWTEVDDIRELPDLEVDVSGMDDLLDFHFSTDPFELLELVLRGVDRLTQRLEDEVRSGTDLGTVPLADVDVADLVVGLREVREQLGAVATDPAATLQGVGDQLNCLLVDALDIETCDDDEASVELVQLEVLHGDDTDTTVVARLDLAVCSPPEDDDSLPDGCAFSRELELPFQLDLAEILERLGQDSLAGLLGSVVGLSSTGQVGVDYDLMASLHAGVVLPDVTADPDGLEGLDPEEDSEQVRFDAVFDVSNPPEVVLFDSTGVRGEVAVDTKVDLEVTVGPLTAAAGLPDRASTVAKVGVGFTLEHEDVSFSLEELRDGALGDPEGLDGLGDWVGELEIDLTSLGTQQGCLAGVTGEAPVTIGGTVEEIDDGGSIENATVTVDDGDGTERSTSTDDDGEFEIDGLPTGSYTITADADEHEELVFVLPDELTSGQTVTVELELAPTPDEPDEGEEPEEPEDGAGQVTDVETDTQAALEEPDRDTEETIEGMQACARLPLYVRDDWIGDIVFTAPDVLKPDGDDDADIDPWHVEVPDDLADRLGEAVLDWQLLFDGLRYVLGHIADGLDGARTGVRVPVVGEVLDGGAELAQSLNEALESLDDDLDHLQTMANAGQVQDELQDLLDEAFSPLEPDEDNGTETASNGDGNGEGSASPITVELQCSSGSCTGDEGLNQIQGAEVQVEFGDEVGTQLPGFDLGFPGLSLTVDQPDRFGEGDDALDEFADEVSALEATVGWALDLSVGVDRNGGFYLLTEKDGEEGFHQHLTVETKVDLPDRLTGDLSLLRVIMDKNGEDGNGEAHDLDLTIGTEVRAGDDGRAPLSELLSQMDKDTFVIAVDANVDLDYALETSAVLPGQTDVEEVFPTLLADFVLDWSFATDSSTGFELGENGFPAPAAFGFEDVRIDLGEFLGGFLGPILAEVQRFTAPFQPVIDTISTPIPGLSDLSVALGQGELTMLTLFEEVSDNDLTFVKRVIGVVEMADTISAASEVADGIIDLGSFQLDAAEALSGAKPANARDDLIDWDEVVQLVDDGGAGLLSSDDEDLPFGKPGASGAVDRARDGGGFSFPAFEEPSNLFGLLVGKDVALVRWDSGTLKASFSSSYNFPPIMVGPVPIGFSLSAAAQIAGRFAMGYDTYGIRRAVAAYNELEDGFSGSDVEDVLGGVSMLFNGLYLDDLDEDGNQVPELVLSAEFAAGAGVSLGIVSAGLELGLRALIDFDLRDPSGTGRIRIEHILDHIRTPICLFEVGGQLDVFLRAFVKISLGLGSKTSRFTIFDIVVLRMDDIFEGFCGPQPPDLAEVVAQVDGEGDIIRSVLVLNTGERGEKRGVGFVHDPDEGLVPDPDEEFVVRPLNKDFTSFSVAAFGEYETYHGITGISSHGRDVRIVADGGEGDDKIQLLDGVASEVDEEQIDAEGEISTEDIEMEADAIICGGPGDDVLVGGRGNDLLVGDGECSVSGGGSSPITIDVDLTETPPVKPDEPAAHEDGNDRLYATAGDNLLFGLGGNDQLYGGTGNDVLVGGSGDDILDAGDPPTNDDEDVPPDPQGDVLIGGSLVAPPSGAGSLPNGADHLTLQGAATPGDDELFGGRGNDVLIGDDGGIDQDGNVWVDGGAPGGDNFLDGGRGDDRLFGGAGDDELYGGRGDDFLYGGAGDDVLVGGSGDDDGNPGANVLVGGQGDDQLIAHDAIVERDDKGRAETLTPVDGEATDDAVLIGGSLLDLPDPGDDELWGSGGDDLLIGDNATPFDEDLAPERHGDVLLFPAGLNSDVFGNLGERDDDGYPTGRTGPTGLDPLDTHGGHDRLYGGPGDDTLIGGPGDDVLVGGYPVRTTGSGTSVARVDAGDDLLIGGDGNDLVIGDHADVVPRDPDAANDPVGADVEATVLSSSDVTSNRLVGGRWGDEVIGDSDPGNDRLLAGRHGDVLVGDDGMISADGTTAQDREVTVLLDDGGNDELIGGAGDDRLFGGPGDDVLRGGGGDDHLEGGPGDDRLFGGDGDDILIGGSSGPGVPSGNNLLVGEAGDDALAGDNARIERVGEGYGLHDSAYLVELYDVPLDGHDPDEVTAGNDVLVGGALGRGTGSDDLLFGQGGDDLLFGDGARLVADDNATALARYGDITEHHIDVEELEGFRFIPIESGDGGDDLLSGGPGDDALFGGPGKDVLLGGSGVMTDYDDDGTVPDDDVHTVPAIDLNASGGLTSLAGMPSGDDLLSGGLDDDLLIGDNARVERIPGEGIDGTEYVVERFDVAIADDDLDPDDVLGGDDVLIGGILGDDEADATTASNDILYGLGGDDLLFGDNAALSPLDAGAVDPYGDIVVNPSWGRFVPVDTGAGGEDRLEGGSGDDVLFGGPGDDILIGGSDRHQPFGPAWDPFPDDGDGTAPGDKALDGSVAGDDVLVGGRGDDVMVGDNARVGGGGTTLQSAGLPFGIMGDETFEVPDVGIELYDVAYAGEDPPHPDTAGDDVLIGGSIGQVGDEVGQPGDDVAFGQGGDDLLIGDDAHLAGDDRRFAPLHDEGGNDHLEGGPGDDVIFGGPGDDLLIGGSSDRAVPDADVQGVVAGDDLLVGGPGQNVALGDNGRLRRADGGTGQWWPHPVSDPAQPWWWQRQENAVEGEDEDAYVAPLAGAAVEPFDEPLLDAEHQPLPETAGDDLIVGGSLRAGISEEGLTPPAGTDAGLLGEVSDDDRPGSGLLHGQAGDDAMFGDDVLVRLDLLGGWDSGSAAASWQTLRRDLADVADEHTDGWPLASLEVDAAGGDDLMLGGPGDDIMFGGPGQDDMIGGSWDAGRLDGRDMMDAGPGHDVAAGDNARITRPLVVDGEWAAPEPDDPGEEPVEIDLEEGLLLCQTYRHLEESELDDEEQTERLGVWSGLTADHAIHEVFGVVSDCVVGETDPGEGIATRAVREVEMLDRLDGDDPTIDEDDIGQVAGSDLIWGGPGDNTIIGQFDDTEDFDAEYPETDPFLHDGDSPWEGWGAERVVEWCRADDDFAVLLAEHEDAFDGFGPDDAGVLAEIIALAETDPAAALALYVGHYVDDGDDYDLDLIRIAGDVLCGGPGEDTILGDQGIVTDIVEDGSRQELIEPQQPFVSDVRFREGTRTRQVELTDITTFDHFERNVGGDDLILGGSGGDAIHGGAGDTIINGNAGDNYIFGGDGDDVIWGGRGDDHIYSGYGDTYLDVRPRPATDGFDGDPPAWFLFGVEADTYQGVDEIYGGWGQDVLQADEASEGPNEEDRLMAWAGAHNLHYVCAATYGAWVSIRNIEPGLLDYLIDKAEGHGALDPGTQGTSGFRELALVYNRDMRHNANPPHPETPGNFTCGAADPASGPGGGNGGGPGQGGGQGNQ